MTINSIFLRRASKVIVPIATDRYDYRIKDESSALVATIDANIRALGYTLDAGIVNELSTARPDAVIAFGKELISTLKEIKGVRSYRAMYPNFPKQVMEASEAELWLNAIIHYWSNGELRPRYANVGRADLDFNESKYQVLKAGTESDFVDLMTTLFKSKSAFSVTDREDIASLDIAHFAQAYNEASSDLANRENKAILGNLALRHGLNDLFVIRRLDTATDVLRLAVAMSDGDVSLAADTKFRSFKRAERRLLLFALNEVAGNLEEDMARYQSAWKRLGERLHPSEYRNKYPRAALAFDAIRINGGVKGFNSRVEKAIESDDAIKAANLLKNRPGEFARRLDKVLRINPSQQFNVLETFAYEADQVSPTVLIQVRNQFANRDKGNRVFFPKGSIAKMQIIEDNRTPLSAAVCNNVISICDAAMVSQFKDRGDLGGSWIDPALKKIAVPFGLRNASKSAKTLGRGSRVPFAADTNFLRFFIWWKNGTWRTDIDLSAVVLDENFREITSITYYNLRGNGAVHSGDIVDAPSGASEFIDIDIDRMVSNGGRYVAMTLHNFTSQQYSELPECFAGFMERGDMQSGEIYDPRTVTNKFDLVSEATTSVPFIFDLVTREAIWVDLSMGIDRLANNVARSSHTITDVMKGLTGLTPPNLYDLFAAHATARGGIVSKDQAKTIFAIDGDVSPLDTEEILANYL